MASVTELISEALTPAAAARIPCVAASLAGSEQLRPPHSYAAERQHSGYRLRPSAPYPTHQAYGCAVKRCYAGRVGGELHVMRTADCSFVKSISKARREFIRSQWNARRKCSLSLPFLSTSTNKLEECRRGGRSSSAKPCLLGCRCACCRFHSDAEGR